MSNPFRITVSIFSLPLACWFIWISFFVGSELLNWIGILSIALYPFLILLALFFVYCLYRSIRGDTGFFFIFLNSFGLLGLLTFVYFGIRFYL